VYRRILGPVYDNVKENWRILNNKDMYAIVQNPTITETVRLYTLGLGMYREWKKIEFPKNTIFEFGNNKIERYRRNRWKNEVKEDCRIVGVEEWQEKVYNREEWKKLLRTARNLRILYMPTELMNVLLCTGTLPNLAREIKNFNWTKLREIPT
jgi:hypothetical protein